MSSKKGKRNLGNKHFPIAESVSIALKIQLDKFLTDENETELKFPTFLSAQERGFIHETVAKLGLKSKSRGKGKILHFEGLSNFSYCMTYLGTDSQPSQQFSKYLAIDYTCIRKFSSRC